MTLRGSTTRHSNSIGSVADWGVVIASIALVLGIVVATVRIAPAQTSRAPTLEKSDPDANKPNPSLPSTGESLSDRLDRGNGVIRPPDGIDNDMSVAPNDPAAGANMPVIRPPSGQGNVRPQ